MSYCPDLFLGTLLSLVKGQKVTAGYGGCGTSAHTAARWKNGVGIVADRRVFIAGGLWVVGMANSTIGMPSPRACIHN